MTTNYLVTMTASATRSKQPECGELNPLENSKGKKEAEKQTPSDGNNIGHTE